MRRNLLRFPIGLMLAVGVAMTCGETTRSLAEEKITASFAFDEPMQGRLTAFVVVNGVLSGAVPGTVELPSGERSVAIEIGIPRLGPTPLFSLALGPQELARGSTDLIVSHYQLMKPTGDHQFSDLSKNTALKPNTKSAIGIQKEGSNAYKLVLPAATYRVATSLLATAHKPETSTLMVKAWKDDSGEYGVNHLGYDGSTGQTVTLAYHGKDTWSGSYDANVSFQGWGPNIPREDWMIVSDPTGANIITEDGLQGSTSRKISVPLSARPYIVLQKVGYADCSYERCKREDTAQGTVLTCSLAKLQ